MAISSPTELFTPGTSNSSKINHSSGAFTPGAGDLVIIAAAVRETSGGGSAPSMTISQTHGEAWSWTKITRSNGDGNAHTLSLWYAVAPSGAGEGVVTVEADEACNRWEVVGVGVSGASGAIVNFNSAESASGSPSITLPSAPASTSVVLGFIASVGDSDGVTPGASFTEISESSGTSTTLQAQFDETSPGATCDWSGAATASNLMIALEIVAPASGGGDVAAMMMAA